MASLPPGSGHPDPWRAKAFSAAGQSCELQPGALSGTSKSTRRGEPNRSRIPLSLLCQRARPRECVRRHARPDLGLTVPIEFSLERWFRGHVQWLFEANGLGAPWSADVHEVQHFALTRLKM